MHFGNLEPIEQRHSTLYSDLRIQQDEGYNDGTI